MRRTTLSLMVFAAACACAMVFLTGGAAGQPTASDETPAAVGALPDRLPLDVGGPAGGRAFRAIEVFVDSAAEPLGAFQIEVWSETGAITVVGVEGGEHAAYAEPPFHDPRAIAGDRVVVGAYSTDADLPTGRTRVARVHVELTGDEAGLRVRLAAAGGADGAAIEADASVELREMP